MPLGSSRFGLSGVGLPDLDVEYLVIAGGGSGGNGGNKCAGGGGAGGYRSSCTDDTYSGELQSVETALTLEKDTAYSVTIGAGGTGGNSAGNTSTFHTISSTGGGHGYSRSGGSSSGGSGGGTAGTTARAGIANQGFAGGRGDYSNYRAGGGGGAGEVGADMYGTYNAVAGGDGIQSSITGTAVYRGGGVAHQETMQTQLTPVVHKEVMVKDPVVQVVEALVLKTIMVQQVLLTLEVAVEVLIPVQVKAVVLV